MFKTKIKNKYTEVLAKEIKKEFDVDFTAIDIGTDTGLVTTKILTKQGVKQLRTFINAFESGVRVVEAELLFNGAK